MVFYYLGGNQIFALRSFMWLAHKPVHITTPIGHEEPDLVKPSILRGPGSLVINRLGYFQKKGTHTLRGLHWGLGKGERRSSPFASMALKLGNTKRNESSS